MKLPRLTPLALLGAATAGTTAGAQQPPAPRPLGPTVATAPEPFGTVSGVRHLSDGRVLVNDAARRRVVLLDSSLAPLAVVADSTSATANAYGGRMAGLIAYRGDSTLFVDPQSLSMLVIDPQGKVARTMSVPRAQDAMSLASGAFGGAAFDGQGRLVYRAFPNFQMRAPGPGGQFMPPEQPDSAAIVRIDLATRQLDTAAFIKIPKLQMNVTQTDDGRRTITSVVNPLPVTDEWALTSTGRIAIVRGRDYHVDWVSPTGERASSPKVPFEWRRLSDEDKVALIDSVKAARERMMANATTTTTADGRQVQTRMAGEAGAAAAMGGGMRITIMEGGPGGGPPPRGGPAGGAPPMPQLTYVSPSELPDYQPPFFAGAVRADADGNVWVRTIPTKAIPGGPIYDVIDQNGALVERVQLPAERTIAGFGAGGVVYLTHRDASGLRLERAKLR